MVGAPSLAVNHVAFLKAHVSRVQAVAVADALLDDPPALGGHHPGVEALAASRERVLGKLRTNGVALN